MAILCNKHNRDRLYTPRTVCYASKAVCSARTVSKPVKTGSKVIDFCSDGTVCF